MNARQLLSKLEGLQKTYKGDLDQDQLEDLALELAQIAEDNRERVSGTSRLEPDFNSADQIYKSLI